MKIRHILLILSALVLSACCCSPDKPVDPGTDEPEQPVTPEKEKPGPGVYKFVIAPDMVSKASVSSAGKTAWEAGDEILVTGGYSPDAITVKLQASDISDDGKTATVKLDKVPGTYYGPDDFYAAWPASVVDNEETFSEDSFSFKSTDAPLMCAWLSGDTFSFNHICAALSFTTDGDYDGCVLAGSNWQIMAYDSWGVEVTSETRDYSYKKGLSSYFLGKDLSNGSAVLYFPGQIDLSDGFKLYMRKGKNYPKVYEASSGPRLGRGEILALGNIGSVLKDYSGPAPEMPEMPVMGNYTKIEVKDVPELSGLCLTADGSALWTVGDNGWFGQVSFDGKVTKWWSKKGDLEGITLHPKTGDLYIANEPQSVFCIKAPDYAQPDSWESVITVAEAKNYGNSGMEGISYYKDDMLFVGTQTGANVWLYKTDGTLVKGPVSLKKVYSGVKEVGGLCYDAVNDWLWVTDSETHKLYVFDAELTHLLAQYPVTYIHNNESVCVDHKNSCVWVGLDDDNVCCIYKLEFTGLN